ncbi:MAG: DUF6850 family outer membrane beta-barrel protein [Bacteroidota bacterium]
MKKNILSVLVLLFIVRFTEAQKGSVLVYGIAGVNTKKESNEDKYTEFSFKPGIGYQFSKHWTAGISGAYGQQKLEPKIGLENKSSVYQVGGFARYTYVFNQIFSFYAHSDMYYHGTKVQEVKSNGFGVAITPTIGINVAKNFALNVSFGALSYETIKIKDADNGTHSFDLDIGKQIGIGVSKNFGGRK